MKDGLPVAWFKNVTRITVKCWVGALRPLNFVRTAGIGWTNEMAAGVKKL